MHKFLSILSRTHLKIQSELFTTQPSNILHRKPKQTLRHRPLGIVQKLPNINLRNIASTILTTPRIIDNRREVHALGVLPTAKSILIGGFLALEEALEHGGFGVAEGEAGVAGFVGVVDEEFGWVFGVGAFYAEAFDVELLLYLESAFGG